MNVSGEQMEGRKKNLIWMIAQEQMKNKQSLSECGWKWEKGFEREIWNSLWVRINVKKPQPTNQKNTHQTKWNKKTQTTFSPRPAKNPTNPNQQQNKTKNISCS